MAKKKLNKDVVDAINSKPTIGPWIVPDGIFWFQRIKDGEYLPYDDERSAYGLVQTPNFHQRFRYIGWSDGSIYRQKISGVAKFSAKEHEDIILKERQDAKRNKAWTSAFESELEVAKQNGPRLRRIRSFQVTNLDGNPADDFLSSMVRNIK